MVYWQLLHLLTLNATSSSRDLCSSDDQKLERSIRKGSLHTCHTSCTLYLRLFTGDRASVKANIPALCSLEEMKLHSLLVCSLLCILHSLWNCKGKKKKVWMMWIKSHCITRTSLILFSDQCYPVHAQKRHSWHILGHTQIFQEYFVWQIHYN